VYTLSFEPEPEYHHKEADGRGNVRYYDKRGQFHRDDGPAIEHANGDKYWYQHGKRHRDDGPAIEYADGGRSWWIPGRRVSEVEYRRWQQDQQRHASLQSLAFDPVMDIDKRLRDLFKPWYSAKPASWEEIRAVRFDDFLDLVHGAELQQLLLSLPVVSTDTDNPWDTVPGAQDLMFFILYRKGRYYVVNSEGYDWPRYLFELVGYPER
jgi:hypothetical protein